MNLKKWAREEIKLATKNCKEDQYGKLCYESALKAFDSLCDDGHSGYSI